MGVLGVPSDPFLTDAMSFRKAIDEIWYHKKKWVGGVWVPGGEAEGVTIKHYARSMFHWAAKSHEYKQFGHTDFPPEEPIMSEEPTSGRNGFGSLQFEYSGDQFAIEFMRFKREIPDHAWKGKKLSGPRPKTHPYTRVNILKLRPGDEPNEVYRTFTVGCHYRDHFTLEDGRRAALRMALKANADKTFTATVFRCYFGRYEAAPNGGSQAE